MTAIDQDALAAFMRRTQRRLPDLPVFDVEDYRRQHPDVSNLDVMRHYAEFGIWEGRPAIAPERRTAKLARAVSLITVDGADQAQLGRAYRGAVRVSPTIHLPCFPTAAEEEAGERLLAGLASVGVTSELRQAPPSNDDPAPIIVDPLRVFGEGAAPRDILPVLSRALVLVFEEPSDERFRAQLPHLLGAGGVLALEVGAFAVAKAVGLPAVWFGRPPVSAPSGVPSDYPLIAGLSRAVRAAPSMAAWRRRPIDVVTIEAASDARALAWTRLSDGLAEVATVMQPSPADAPTPADVRTFLYARSKFVLHLHEASATPLPAVLAAEVAGAGAVLITEPSPSNGLLVPDRHYFETSARRIPALVRTLIDSKQGAARAEAAAAAAKSLLMQAFAPESVGPAVVCALLDVSEK